MAPTFESSILIERDEFSTVTYLPPNVTRQINVVTYIHIGMTTLLIWDTLDNLRKDYRLLFFYKFGIPTFIHLGARISLLVYALGRAVLLTAPVGDCTTLAHSINIFPLLFVIFTSLLIYIRVYAIYNRDRLTGILFGIPSLAAVGMSSTFFITMGAENIATTQYCVETSEDPHHFLVVTYTIFLFDETVVYLAVVWKIYLMFLEHTGTSLTHKFQVLVYGASLPILSRIILLDSQVYFLYAVISKAFLVLSIIFLKPPLRTMFIICHLVFVNILASRVYRNLKMGLDDHATVQSIVLNLSSVGHPLGQKPVRQSVIFKVSNRGSNSVLSEVSEVEIGIQTSQSHLSEIEETLDRLKPEKNHGSSEELACC